MTNLWERTNLQTDAYFAGTEFRRKLAFNSPSFKYTIRRETGMPCSRSSNIQRSRRKPTQSRQEGRPLWVETAFRSDFFSSSFRQRHRLTLDGWTSWSLQIYLREWPRSWHSAASLIISCLLRQETIFRRTATVVFIVASVLVFVRKTDYICVNRAPLFLYFYKKRKNLEEHGAPLVKYS